MTGATPSTTPDGDRVRVVGVLCEDPMDVLAEVALTHSAFLVLAELGLTGGG